MTIKKFIVGITCIEFAIFTLYAVAQIESLTVLLNAFTGDWMVMQVFFDLLLCLAFISVWTWQDARSKGVNPIPYMFLYWTIGSIGVMIYLLRHVIDKSPAKEHPLDSRGQHQYS